MTHEERIAAYQDAYFAANGRAVGVTYKNGWYLIGWPTSKYRPAAVENLTAELRRRAAQAKTP